MEQITNKPSRVRRTQEQIEQLLEEFEKGEIKVSKFCELHGISHTTLRKWQSRYKRKAEKNSRPAGFAKLKIHTPDLNLSSTLFAEVHGIKLYQSVAPSYLKELAAL